MKSEDIAIGNAREVGIRLIFTLLLFATLLTQIKMPYFKYGIHNVLIPIFSLVIITLSGNAVKAVIVYHRRTLLLMFLLYLWMWVSAVFSEFNDTSIKFSIKYSFYPFLFVSLLFLTFNNKNITIYYRLIFYYLLLLSVFGIIEEIYPELSIFRFMRPSITYMPRVSSLLQNPNPFGSLMSFSVILVMLLRNNGIICRMEFIISSIMFILTAFLSGSRNALLVLVIGMGAVLFYRYNVMSFKKDLAKFFLTVVALILFGVLLYKLTIPTSLVIIMSHFYTTGIAARLLLWKSALRESIRHPIAGIGMEVFSKHIAPYVLESPGLNTHSMFLNILVELGVVGLLLSLTITYSLLKKVDFKNSMIVIPVIMFFASSIADYFIYETTFMIISLFFLALAGNSKNEYYQKPSLAI